MNRTPEPRRAGDAATRMDAIYRPQRMIYDATRKFFLPGRDRLIAGLALPRGGTVLELGCGTARNLVKAAKAWPKAKLFGIDVSSEMLKTASANVNRSKLAERISLAQGDATRFDPQSLFGVGRFDRVVISYALSMIPDWEIAVEAGIGVLANGGSLHVVDFGGQSRMPRGYGRLLSAFLSKFDVAPRKDLEAVLRHAALRHHARIEFEELYRDYTRLAVIRLAAV
jgi:S-adenosylmethionine-diacylgycerolhomoserine-N-methlytransferase